MPSTNDESSFHVSPLHITCGRREPLSPQVPPTSVQRQQRQVANATLGVMRDLQEEFRAGVQPATSSSSSHGGSEGRAPSSWWSGDPEAKRRRRVAGYKSYAVEARVKASLRKGFRWIKDRCTGLVRRY